MSIRKFRCPNLSACAEGETIRLEKDEENHLFKTLRASPGDLVELLDGQGRIAQAEVIPGKLLKLNVLRRIPVPERRIHLYIAPPRRQKMDAVLREATELGVWKIVPMNCAYGVSEPDAESVAGRWNDVMFESCKQSGNAYLPKTESPRPFAECVRQAFAECGRVYYGSPTVAHAPETLPQDIAWFIGPEGGFSEAEETCLKESGALPLRIGNWILRVETAAVVGIGVLLSR